MKFEKKKCTPRDIDCTHTFYFPGKRISVRHETVKHSGRSEELKDGQWGPGIPVEWQCGERMFNRLT